MGRLNYINFYFLITRRKPKPKPAEKRQGLLLAWNSSFTHIIYETDSVPTLTLINKEDSSLYPYAEVINRIHCQVFFLSCLLRGKENCY